MNDSSLPLPDVSELQRDALAEIFNIGVGRAANTLSQIVNEEIELSAPTVHFMRSDEIGHSLDWVKVDKLSLIFQDFTGEFDARTLLIFPESNALLIVGHLLGEMVPPEELSAYEQEAMCEVGNIILNACISALADVFHCQFEGSLPEYRYASRERIDLAGLVSTDSPVVLAVQTQLIIKKQSIQGQLIFLMSVSSLNALLQSINHFLAREGLA